LKKTYSVLFLYNSLIFISIFFFKWFRLGPEYPSQRGPVHWRKLGKSRSCAMGRSLWDGYSYPNRNNFMTYIINRKKNCSFLKSLPARKCNSLFSCVQMCLSVIGWSVYLYIIYSCIAYPCSSQIRWVFSLKYIQYL
jgi:hypothetical protein